MKKRIEHGVDTPVASLIDVVFLLIIFFVVTAAVDNEVVDMSIMLAQARYVTPVDTKDPRTITINVNEDGAVNIAMQRLNVMQLQSILVATVARSGNNVPILIRCDGRALFSEIDKIIDAVERAGLYRIQLAAVVQ